MTSDSQSLYQRLPGTVTSEIDGELVALNVAKGTCYGLNAIATRVWNLILDAKSLEEICSVLIAEYAVDDQTCRTDVGQLLEDLVGEELVERRT